LVSLKHNKYIKSKSDAKLREYYRIVLFIILAPTSSSGLDPSEQLDGGVKAAAEEGEETKVAESTPTTVLRVA